LSSQEPPAEPPPNRRDAKAELKAAKAYAKAHRPWYKKKRWIISLGLILLIVLVSVASSGSSDKDSASSGGSSSSSSSGSGKSDCGTTATDNCTPVVQPGGSVRVDALRWKVLSARTASTIGDTTYGGGAKADGVFVIVKLQVHSLKDQSATLTDDAIKLHTSGAEYSADSDGSIAADFSSSGGGDQPFFLKDIGPDVTTKGIVVFDVPKTLLHKSLKIRFNELGLGSTHGFIRLPSLA
jgi:hypothetical protein